MPRSMWNGALAFGSVTVPVKAFAATDPQALRLREVHLSDEAPIAHRHYDPETGAEVPSEDIARGAETGDGEWVLLSAEELRSAERPKRKAVEIEVFVPEAEIDPIYYEKAYNLAPQPSGSAGYGVLHAALRQTHRAGVGRVVLRSRERLVTVRAESDLLRMHTMRFHDELVPASKIRVEAKTRKPTKAEMQMAGALIDTLVGELEPQRLKDTYRDRVIALARRKAKGQPVQARPKSPPKPTDDLLETLRQSIAVSRG